MMAHNNKKHSSGWKNPNRIMNRKISGLLIASPRLMTMSVMEKRIKVNQMVCFLYLVDQFVWDLQNLKGVPWKQNNNDRWIFWNRCMLIKWKFKHCEKLEYSHHPLYATSADCDASSGRFSGFLWEHNADLYL